MTTCSKISSYTDISRSFHVPIGFKSDSFKIESVFGRGFNPPVPDDMKAAQRDRIARDLADANEKIAFIEKNREKIEKKFQAAWADEKERCRNGFNIIKKDGQVYSHWRNINNSFWCLPADYELIPKNVTKFQKHQLDAIVALKDFLESNGIQLIVSIVPNSYMISSRVINPEFKDVPVYQCAIYTKQLSEVGVECPYEASRIIGNHNKFPFAYLFPFDRHPGATAQYSVAEEIADRLSCYHFNPKLDSARFSYAQVAPFASSLQRFPPNCDIGSNKAGEIHTAEEVHYDGKVLKRDPSSEILILGNSFIESPTGRSQNSFTAFLSERMRYPVDDYRVSSYGPMTTIIQRMFEFPEAFLKGKKVVILQVGTMHINPNVRWYNIAEMDRKKLMLNGKKLVNTLYISGNGDFAGDFVRDIAKKAWASLEGKKDIKCFDYKAFEIFNQKIPNLDESKPFVCVIQTARSALFATPTLIANGIRESIPAAHDPSIVLWQDIYFQIPAGTSRLKLELQGKKNTIVGFNKIFIYQ